MSDLLDPPHHDAGPSDATGLSHFRRLAVYETPGMHELLARLADLAPDARFVPTATSSPPPRGPGIPVWHWSESIEEFAADAESRLRNLVYPMLADDRPCCFSFAFAKSELQPRALDVSSLNLLDLENIGRLFALDVVEETYSLLPELAGRLTLTPIETLLQRALQRADIDANPQVKFDRFRLDFLVEVEGRRIAIEADGRNYHDAERDARRDEELRRLGIERVLRFTGSEIWLDADACAARVALLLRNGALTPPRLRRQSLDDSQLKAVGHGGGPARVLAPAGAGKTRVLANRIAELIERGVEPASILAFAFNKKANDQLVERLSDDLGVPVSPTTLFDPSNQGVVCATFNAFGYRYQRELLSLKHRMETSQQVWRELMARAIRESGATLKGAKRGSDPVGEFLRALDRVRADLANPEEVVVELDTLDQQGSQVVPFAPVYDAYQRLRLDAAILGFGDQLHVALLDLLGNPRNREFVQSRFRHVLVDEYQDLNAAQLALVDIVSSPWRNLYVVGDDDQLIYGWRFANLTNILDFHERMPPRPYSTTYVLSTNYRSSRAIVESSRRVIDHNQEREKKDIQPTADAPAGEVRYVRSTSWRERADEVVRILKEHKTPRSQYRELAVLCRYKAQQPFVALALDRAGIPRTQLLSYRLFSDRHMQLLRAYMQLVRHPRGIDGDRLRLLLNRPERYVKNDLVEAIAEAPRPWERLTASLNDPDCPASLKNLCARTTELHEQCKADRPSSSKVVQDVLSAFALESYWRNARGPQAPVDKDEADAAQLLGLIRLHAEELADPTDFLGFWDASAQRERELFDTAPDSLEREVRPEDDRVVIGTMHSSKGREYDAVVLYDYDADLSTLTPKQVEEERRVFYVGLTRARDSALITIDGSAGLPQFVRESIAPRQPEEEASIEGRLRELRTAEGDLVVTRVRLERELDAIASGAELERCRAALDEVSAALLPLEAELSELAPLLQEPSVWARLRGHAAQARRRAEQLRHDTEVRSAERDKLEHRIDLLATEPWIVAAPLDEARLRVEDELESIRDQQRALRGRLHQLLLIGPAAN